MAATAQETFDDLDPFTGEVVAEVPAGGAKEVKQGRRRTCSRAAATR
jgi:acyl-CoA reductase-like NAD-dependent aldehyde dehydrogenase